MHRPRTRAGWLAIATIAALGCSVGRTASPSRGGDVDVSVTHAALTASGGLTTDALLNNDIWRTGKRTDIWVNGVWADGLWANGNWINGIWINGLRLNGAWANGLWANGIWASPLSGNNAIPGNAVRNDNDASTRLLLQVIYACALPPTTFDTTLDPNGGSLTCSGGTCDVGYSCSSSGRCVIPLQGAVGLAINADGSTWWDSGACDESCQRWISACVLARTNGNGLHRQLSLRSPTAAPPGHELQFIKIQAALATTLTETDGYPLREGAFYGNIFATTPVDPPPSPAFNGPASGAIVSTPNFYACAGPASTVTAMTERFCPSLSGSCGINVPGACETTQSGLGTCDGVDSSGSEHGCHATADPLSTRYEEVITVYLPMPIDICGNGICEPSETLAICPSDCGGSVDAGPPVLPAPPDPPVLTSPLDGEVSSTGTVSVAGTGVPDAVVTILLDGAVVATAPADSSGAFAVTVALNLGEHALSATQSVAGITSDPSAPVTVLVPPPAPSLSAPPSGDVSNHAFIVAGTGVPGAAISVDASLDGHPEGSFGTVAATDGTFTVPVSLTGGTHTLSATQTVNHARSAPSGDLVVAVRQTCTSPTECARGLCIDGFCCDVPCGAMLNDCQACSRAAGGSDDGRCTPVVDGRTCGTSGACRVAATCSPTSMVCPSDAPAAAGTLCDAPLDFCDWIQPTCDQATLSCPAHVAWATNACQPVSSTAPTNLGGGQGTNGGVTVTLDGPLSTDAGTVDIGVRKLSQPPTCPSSVPPGFKVGSAGQYWQIETSPPALSIPGATLCFNYLPTVLTVTQQCNLQLYHGDATTCSWGPPITTDICPSNGNFCGTSISCVSSERSAGTVCGHVDNHFSPFGLFVPEPGDVPTVTVPGPMVVGATTAAGAVVAFAASAHDTHDGDIGVQCTPASGSAFPLGTTTVVCSATNSQGFRGEASFTVSVKVQAPTDGTFFLQPINPDGSSIFKKGSTVPVKFKLQGASAGIKDLVAHLSVAKVSNGIAGTSLEAVSTSAADAGNAFRYDPSCGQYVFNLSTKTMATGTWSLRADLGDLVDHVVQISLR